MTTAGSNHPIASCMFCTIRYNSPNLIDSELRCWPIDTLYIPTNMLGTHINTTTFLRITNINKFEKLKTSQICQLLLYMLLRMGYALMVSSKKKQRPPDPQEKPRKGQTQQRLLVIFIQLIFLSLFSLSFG